MTSGLFNPHGMEGGIMERPTKRNSKPIKLSSAKPGMHGAAAGCLLFLSLLVASMCCWWSPAHASESISTAFAATPVSITSIVIDRANPETLYAGADGEGVYNCTNRDTSWVLVNSGLSSLGVRSVAINPKDSRVLYAGTGDDVFRSTNKARKWTQINSGLSNRMVSSLAVDPKAPSTLYAGTSGGLFKTVNGGTEWTEINSGLKNRSVHAVAVDSSTGETLFAGMEGGAFKSTDGGGSWKPANSGLKNVRVHSSGLHPKYSTVVYAGTEGGVFQSDNGGAKWRSMLHLLHSFGGAEKDGNKPENIDLIQDGSTFYGMTNAGGTYGKGVIFEFSDDINLKVLHSFVRSEGAVPSGSLVLGGRHSTA